MIKPGSRQGADPEPMVEGTRLAVADVVRAAYEQGTERVARNSAGEAMPEAEVLEAVRYCAEQSCHGGRSYCRACRLWTKAQGLASLDDFLSRYAEISLAGSALLISSPDGRGRLEAPSLEALVRSWAGEEFWFLARRVLRRVERREQGAFKTLRPAGAVGPVVILVEPQMADNIGMVARAMANCELEELRLVAPRDGWPNAKAEAAASGAQPIVAGARDYGDLKAAIGDLHWLAATTARPRHLAKPVLTPEAAAGELRDRIAAGQRCGVVFGPERTGLSTEHVALADAVVMAPVNPQFASLNLSQAVLLVGYEWLKHKPGAGLGRRNDGERAAAAGLDLGSPPASKAHLLGLLDHVEAELERAGHFRPPEKRPTMLRNLRTLIERMALSEQEVRTLRGVVTSLTRTPRG